MSISEITRMLDAQAEEKFGRQRADELRPEIEQMASQLAQLYSSALDLQDEA